MGDRPTWDETWMAIAHNLGSRSLCERAQVGAVVVTVENIINSTGYNGPPAAQRRRTTCSDWCERSQAPSAGTAYGLACPTIHAEANALIRADHSKIQFGSIYVTRTPCQDCAKLMSNSGLQRVVFNIAPEDGGYDITKTVEFIKGCGLHVTILNGAA